MNKLLKKYFDRNECQIKTAKMLKYRRLAYEHDGILRLYYKKKCNKILKSFVSYFPIESQIGEGLVLPHGPSGIFISKGAVIGKNCVIFQQVTIGSNTLDGTKRPGIPVIGDNVYIGAGAKIIGGVTVGNNVRIGANSVVIDDIPDNTTVVLEHPRLLPVSSTDNTFIPYDDYMAMKSKE